MHRTFILASAVLVGGLGVVGCDSRPTVDSDRANVESAEKKAAEEKAAEQRERSEAKRTSRTPGLRLRT